MMLKGYYNHKFISKRLLSSVAKFDGEISSIYNSIAENHRHVNGPWHLMLKKLQDKYANTNISIVDIASGPGEPARTIANAMPYATVFSTDVSVDMHKLSSIHSITVNNMKSMVMDAQDLSPFKSESIDAITCCYGYMFPDDKIKCLSEAYRILKPKGILISAHWVNLDAMHICKKILKAIYTSQPNQLPLQQSPINPMALSEPGLFNSICIAAGYFFLFFLSFTLLLLLLLRISRKQH